MKRWLVPWVLIGEMVALSFFARIDQGPDPGADGALVITALAQVFIVSVWPIWLIGVLTHPKEPDMSKACTVLVGGW